MEAEAPPETPASGNNGGGRKSWVPTDHQRQSALMLYGMGATDEQVARQLGVSKSTAQKHLGPEREQGWEWANLQLYGALWKKAVVQGNIAGLIFLAKNRLGMSDRQDVNHSGDAAPIRGELSIRVEYVPPADPRALPPPPPERFAMLEGKANEPR